MPGETPPPGATTPPGDRRAKLRNLAAETRRMIAEDADRRASELREAVRGGSAGEPAAIGEALRRIQEGG